MHKDRFCHNKVPTESVSLSLSRNCGSAILSRLQQEFKVVPTEAEIVRWIFELYINGWGCKRIANFLTDERIPTSRMSERERKEAESKRKSIRTRFFVPMSSVTGPLLRNHCCSEAAFPP